MSFYSRTNPKARKHHRCYMCGRGIAPGETYMNGVNFDDGVFVWKECSHCERLFGFLHGLYGEDEYSVDDAYDWEVENLAELRVKACFRLHWRRKDGSLMPMPELITEQREWATGGTYTKVLGIKMGEAT